MEWVRYIYILQLFYKNLEEWKLRRGQYFHGEFDGKVVGVKMTKKITKLFRPCGQQTCLPNEDITSIADENLFLTSLPQQRIYLKLVAGQTHNIQRPLINQLLHINESLRIYWDHQQSLTTTLTLVESHLATGHPADSGPVLPINLQYSLSFTSFRTFLVYCSWAVQKFHIALGETSAL